MLTQDDRDDFIMGALNAKPLPLIKDNQSTPQPIATAPMDGAVILTDEGIARFWGGRWQDSRGTVLPEYWTPLPDWIKKLA